MATPHDRDDATMDLDRLLERRELTHDRARRLLLVALASGKIGHDIGGMLLPIRAAASGGGERSRQAAGAAIDALQSSGKALQLLTLDPLSPRGGSRADLLETWRLVEPVARAAIPGPLQVEVQEVARTLTCPRAMLAQGLFDLATHGGAATSAVRFSLTGADAGVAAEAEHDGQEQPAISPLLRQLAAVLSGECTCVGSAGQWRVRLALP